MVYIDRNRVQGTSLPSVWSVSEEVWAVLTETDPTCRGGGAGRHVEGVFQALP